MTRVCANPDCGTELVQRGNESHGDFRMRRCCSHPCNAAVIRIKSLQRIEKMSVRFCALDECGKSLVPHQDESPSRFRQRRFCDQSCAGREGAKIGKAAARTRQYVPEPGATPLRGFSYPVGYLYENDKRLPHVRRHGEPETVFRGSARDQLP